MVIYLTHPVHGTKVATMEIEAINDEKNGWVRYTPNQENNTNSLRKGRKPRSTNVESFAQSIGIEVEE